MNKKQKYDTLQEVISNNKNNTAENIYNIWTSRYNFVHSFDDALYYLGIIKEIIGNKEILEYI